MPNLPRTLLAPVQYVPLLCRRFVLPMFFCVALTALNAAVILTFGPLLYRVSSNHPLWLAGLTLLFSALIASLLRVWVEMFRSRFC